MTTSPTGPRRCGLALAFALALAVPRGSAAEDAAPDAGENAPAAGQLALRFSVITAAPRHASREGKRSLSLPEKEDITDRLDIFHRSMNIWLQGGAHRLDNLFAEENTVNTIELENSSFALGVELKLREHDGMSVEIKPDFDASLRLPRLKQRINLFIDSTPQDDLPGVELSERERNLAVGLGRAFRRTARRPSINLRAGARWRSGPVVFGSAAIKRRFFGPDGWIVEPESRNYWFNDDGYGTLAGLTTGFVRPNEWSALSLSAVKWSEVTTGVEWEQSFAVVRVLEGTDRDVHRSLGARISVFGHKDSSGVVDLYRYSIVHYKMPLYRRWLYLRVIPELEWRREHGWDTEYVLRLGVEALFEGGIDR